MLRPLKNEKVVVSVNFRQQIGTISNSKVLEIDLELVKKKSSFAQQRKNELCNTFFVENIAAFCFKNTNIFLLSTSSFLSNPCLHFDAFWIQNDGKGSTRIERLFQSAFREKLFSEKMKTFTR